MDLLGLFGLYCCSQFLFPLDLCSGLISVIERRMLESLAVVVEL